MLHKAIVPALLALAVVSCGGNGPADTWRSSQRGSGKKEGEAKMAEFTVSSSAFEEGGMIPTKYTCQAEGEEVSPPLTWEGLPEKTKSIALIADDPDAPGKTWVHWVVWNIPADQKGLEENVPKTTELESGAVQGVNDFKKHGYGGPCPPSGTHRYYFKVYALDTKLQLKEDATKADLQEAMEGHVLAHGQLMGKYSKK